MEIGVTGIKVHVPDIKLDVVPPVHIYFDSMVHVEEQPQKQAILTLRKFMSGLLLIHPLAYLFLTSRFSCIFKQSPSCFSPESSHNPHMNERSGMSPSSMSGKYSNNSGSSLIYSHIFFTVSYISQNSNHVHIYLFECLNVSDCSPSYWSY